MQWGQLKTLFIICFLILDIYLIYQIMDRQEETGNLFSPETTSIQEELDRRNINYDNIPKDTMKAAYISASWHSFTDEELEVLQNQEIINNGDMIYSILKEPVPLKPDTVEGQINEFVTKNVLYSDQYNFYKWNKEEDVLIFFQHYNKKPIYFNNGGMLMVFLNEKLEITSYAQSMQEDIITQIEEKEVSKPIEIVEVLLNNNEIYSGDKISSMELGYHTFFPVGKGIQAFVPTWKITVNDNVRTYFVNAMDGEIIVKNELKFINDIKQLIEQVKSKPGSEES